MTKVKQLPKALFSCRWWPSLGYLLVFTECPDLCTGTEGSAISKDVDLQLILWDHVLGNVIQVLEVQTPQLQEHEAQETPPSEAHRRRLSGSLSHKLLTKTVGWDIPFGEGSWGKYAFKYSFCTMP